MDKTNQNTQNTLTNTASAQQQARLQHTGARAASASTPIVQGAPSLADAIGANSNIRSVESAAHKKLDIAFNILKQLFEKMLSDESAMDKILQMLSKRDPKTQKTLVEQFFSNKHVDGETFVHHFLKGIPIFLYISLNKNFQYPNPRSTILNVLTFKLFKKCIFNELYSSKDSYSIEKIENLIKKILFSPVYLKGSKTSIGVFQLAQVVNQQSIGEIQDYIFDYFNALDRGAWSETSPGQCALYFAYGFLGKNLDVLSRLFSCLEKCTKPEFKAQTEQKISELFGYFLDDLSESYIKDYRITPNAYDNVIHYICHNCPQLLDLNFHAISNHCAREESANLRMNLLALKNSKGQCFLDLIYDKQDARLMGLVDANLVESPQAIISSAPLIQNLELPNLKEHLVLISQQPKELLKREELFRYLLFSIILNDIDLVQYFRDIKINTPEESQRLVVSLIHLAECSFELCPSTLNSYFPYKNIKNTTLLSRELFFKILESLNPLKVLEQVDLTTNLLSRCLDKDLESDLLRDSTPIFDYVLENLQKIGFDLHYIDPETGHNILSKAYELEMDLGNLKLFNKLLCLGCNPFLVRKEGVSVYVQLNSNRRYGKLAIPVVLEAVGLNKHPFLPLSFTKNILKDNRLDQKDAQGRTPLMVYVMCNIDLKDLFGNSLQKLERKHLEALDNKGWMVFDYAENNEDQVSLKLLNARKEALERKANKPSLFRQAAGLAAKLVTSSESTNDTSDKSTASISSASKTRSSASKRRQARKLKAQEGASPTAQALTPEITLNYNAETGTSTTSMKEVREEAAAAIAKEETKKKRKEDREKTTPLSQNQEGAPTPKKEKGGLLARAKNKLKVVATTLEAAKNFTQNPQAFVKTLASKLSQTKAGERLSSGQRVYNIGKAKAFAMLEDGLWLGNFSTMTDLANEAIGKGLTTPPSNGVIKTLEAMDHAIAIGKSTKINRLTILEAAQWVLGGSIETGHGSHMNLHYTGGVLTIPESKDGSENANIVYIKKAAGLMSQRLRSLLLGYELSQSTLSSSDSSEEDKWTLERINNDGETSSEENAEEGRNKTPEPSESSE